VNYVYDKNNEKLIPKDVRAKVEEIRSKIISNDIIIN